MNQKSFLPRPKIACRAFLLLLFAIAARGAEDAAWTLTSAVTSRYLFRGVEIAKECFQPSLEYSAGSFTAGIWSSAAFSDRVSGDSDPELDLYGSYTFANEGGTWSLVPGFSLYTYPDARRTNGLYAATFEPSLALNATVLGVRFTPKVYYDLMLKGATLELAAGFALPLKRFGTELAFAATVGTFKWDEVTADAAPAEKNWGDYWSAGVTLPVQIGVRSQLALNVFYSEGRNNFYKQGTSPRLENEAAVGATAVTLSYAVTF